MSKTHIKFIFILIIAISLASCVGPDGKRKFGADARKNPDDPALRVKKNLEEGRGFRVNDAFKTNRGVFEFASSNPLWRASLEIIDFMPLTTVDYSGGIIITDWYNDSSNQNESIKITLRFLSNEIKSNSIKVIVHNKKCKTNENCKIDEIDSKIKFELQKSILAKAAQLEILAKKEE